jgi:hypothetical protein
LESSAERSPSLVDIPSTVLLKIKQVLLNSCLGERMQSEGKAEALNQSSQARVDSDASI